MPKLKFTERASFDILLNILPSGHHYRGNSHLNKAPEHRKIGRDFKVAARLAFAASLAEIIRLVFRVLGSTWEPIIILKFYCARRYCIMIIFHFPLKWTRASFLVC